MSIHRRVAVALAALLMGAASLPAQAPKIKESKPGLLMKAKISADSAIARAQAKLPKAKFAAGEISEKGGKLTYSFEFKTDGKSGIDEVSVDAMTGKVGKLGHESPDGEEKGDRAKATKKPDSTKATVKRP